MARKFSASQSHLRILMISMIVSVKLFSEKKKTQKKSRTQLTSRRKLCEQDNHVGADDAKGDIVHVGGWVVDRQRELAGTCRLQVVEVSVDDISKRKSYMIFALLHKNNPNK